MNTAELVVFLGKVAEELQIPPPSQSKVESWITKDLIAGSKPAGKGRNIPPAWEVPLSSVSAARLILELGAKGARRSNELRIGLWLAGHDIPLDAFREALTKEARRVVQHMLRRNIPQTLQLTEFGDGKRSAALSGRLGPLDTRFANGGLQLSEELYFDLSRIAFLTNRDEADENSLVSEMLRNVAPGLSPLLSSMSIGNVFAGLLGSPDEVDSNNLDLVQRASQDQLERARGFYQFFVTAIETGALRLPLGLHGDTSDGPWIAAAQAMRHPRWMPLVFLIFLRLVVEVKFDAPEGDRGLLTPELARSLSGFERMVRSLQVLEK